MENEDDHCFHAINTFYKEGTFCDLKIAASESAKHVLCHATVMCSILPQLKQLLLSNNVEDNFYTIIVDGSSAEEISDIINSVYEKLSGGCDQFDVSEIKGSLKNLFGIKDAADKLADLKGIQVCKVVGVKLENLVAESVEETEVVPDDIPEIIEEKETDVKEETASRVIDLSSIGSIADLRSKLNLKTPVKSDDLSKKPLKRPASKTGPVTPPPKVQKKAPTIYKLEIDSRPIRRTGKGVPVLECSLDDPCERACHYCKEKLPAVTKEDREAFRLHILNHLRCDCDIVFNDEDDYKEHYKKVHGNDPSGIDTKPVDSKMDRPCSYCVRDFPYSNIEEREEFKNHIKKHMTCECNMTFKNERVFREHIKFEHASKFYRCAVEGCGKSYKRRDLFEVHDRMQHNYKSDKSEESAICPTCGRVFVDVYYMKSHFKLTHADTNCSICGHLSQGTLASQKHRREAHSQQLSVICDLCGQTFKNKRYLATHIMNKHTEDKNMPHKCHLCPKGFVTRHRLFDHVERDHKGNRAYTCRAPGCDRTFTLREVCARHEKRDHNLKIVERRGTASKYEYNQKEISKPWHSKIMDTEVDKHEGPGG